MAVDAPRDFNGTVTHIHLRCRGMCSSATDHRGAAFPSDSEHSRRHRHLIFHTMHGSILVR
jgi:hypothetical protein